MNFQKRGSQAVLFSLCLIVSLVALAPKAYAYLDPGLGSFLVQMLVAGLLGVIVAVRGFWGNILSFLKRFKKPPKNNPS